MYFRIGIVFNVASDIDKYTGQNDAGVAFLLAFNYVKESKGPQEALAFITDVYNRVNDETKDISVSDVHEYFKSKFGASKTKEVFEPESEYDVGRTLASDFLERSGFQESALPQVLMNGVPLGIIFVAFLTTSEATLVVLAIAFTYYSSI